MSLKGKVALITGSTQGIGLAIAQVLAASGVHIGLNGLGDAQKIESTRSSLATGNNIKALYDPADLRDPAQIRRMIQRVTTELGPISILVNNAAIQHVSRIEDFDEGRYNDVIAVNLSSAFHTMKHTIPGMKEQGWGRIINIASAHATVASINKCAYVASKHGIIGITKAVALELAQTNITCNAICPGWVLTDLVLTQIHKRAEQNKISFEEAKEKFIEEKHPSKRAVEAAHVGEAVKFLCSEAGREIRGISLNMDGGWWAQ